MEPSKPCSFEQLYRVTFPQLHRFFAVRVKEIETAEDLTSETFFRARRRWPPRNLNGSVPKAWLFQIARHLLVDHYRAEQRQTTEPLDEVNTPAGTTQLGGQRHSEQLTVKMAFGTLSQQDQTVLSLRLAGLKNSEIAEVLDMTEGAAAMACLRAMKRLQKQVEAD